MKVSFEETNPITLSRHVLQAQALHPEATGDLTLLLVSIQVACAPSGTGKFVAPLDTIISQTFRTGLAGSVNVQGEDVKKLDVVANEIFINCLSSSGKVLAMVSEEDENILLLESKSSSRKYCVAFDPLDGSSNIDAGVSIGTIFGIYHIDETHHKSPKDCFFRSGSNLISAGYALYGSFTIMVLALGEEVNGYTLDPISIPPGKIYSVNEGNSKYWNPGCTKFFHILKFPEGNNKPYSSRYVGSMVADVHRTLLYGGIFAYPADSKSPQGKLRLLYECFPMALIMEKAGGAASNGRERILDLVPNHIHDRSPIILGNKDDVKLFESLQTALQTE